MGKSCVGVDIGTSTIKLAVCADGEVRRLVVEDLPNNLVREGRIVSLEAATEFIKETASKAKINTRHCAVVLPSSVAFTRTIILPVMTEEHLRLNLPYEFRDFITQEKDKYVYDYAVIGSYESEESQQVETEYIVATTLKETIADYSTMFRRAGFKLVTAIPDELAYMNIVRAFQKKHGQAMPEREYCFIDLGHTATRLYIFRGVRHQATRVIEYGVQMLDIAIAEQLNVDEHIASVYKHANNNNELESEACRMVYANIAVEIMRAINFYRFNSPDGELNEVYLCGGGARIKPLVEQIATDISMPVLLINDLLPDSAKNMDDTLVCQMAIGTTLQ